MVEEQLCYLSSNITSNYHNLTNSWIDKKENGMRMQNLKMHHQKGASCSLPTFGMINFIQSNCNLEEATLNGTLRIIDQPVQSVGDWIT